jgi:hypothetical protein
MASDAQTRKEKEVKHAVKVPRSPVQGFELLDHVTVPRDKFPYDCHTESESFYVPSVTLLPIQRAPDLQRLKSANKCQKSKGKKFASLYIRPGL